MNLGFLNCMAEKFKFSFRVEFQLLLLPTVFDGCVRGRLPEIYLTCHPIELVLNRKFIQYDNLMDDLVR